MQRFLGSFGWTSVTVIGKLLQPLSVLAVACSRLQDSGEKSFSKKKCEKRAGAGERQGGALT